MAKFYRNSSSQSNTGLRLTRGGASIYLPAVEKELLSLSGSSNTSILKQEILEITSSSQTTFTLQTQPLGSKIVLSLNGQVLTVDGDYSLSGNTINILNSNYIESSDILIASYLA